MPPVSAVGISGEAGPAQLSERLDLADSLRKSPARRQFYAFSSNPSVTLSGPIALPNPHRLPLGRLIEGGRH
jgi:hypothetical protein